MGVLAIAGEPGAPDRLQKAQNALQNWIELGNELHGDGGYKTYSYQDTFLIVPAIMWSMAIGQDVVRRNQFVMHHADFLLRRLSQDGDGFRRGSRRSSIRRTRHDHSPAKPVGTRPA